MLAFLIGSLCKLCLSMDPGDSSARKCYVLGLSAYVHWVDNISAGFRYPSSTFYDCSGLNAPQWVRINAGIAYLFLQYAFISSPHNSVGTDCTYLEDPPRLNFYSLTPVGQRKISASVSSTLMVAICLDEFVWRMGLQVKLLLRSSRWRVCTRKNSLSP